MTPPLKLRPDPQMQPQPRKQALPALACGLPEGGGGWGQCGSWSVIVCLVLLPATEFQLVSLQTDP